METKPGQKTTEFWITMLVNVLMFLNMINVWNFMPNRYSAITMAFVTGLYSVARGQAKSGVKPD